MSLRNLYIVYLTKKGNSPTVIQAIKELGSVKTINWEEVIKNDKYRFKKYNGDRVS